MNSPIQIKKITSTLFIGIALLFVNSTTLAAPDGNTSYGVGALSGGTKGSFNTGLGFNALHENTFGNWNTAVGYKALERNAQFVLAIGNRNTAIGTQALGQLGNIANAACSNNIAVGYQAGYNLTFNSNNIDIGNQGVNGDLNTIRIGDSHTRTFIAGISGAAVSGAGVVVDASGQLGVAASSARFKDQIKPMDKASEAILSLKPVAFRYKKEIDPARSLQFGLVAEEVEKVNPDLVACDGEGKPFSVRYEAVNAMLLNEFLKEHHQVQDLKAIIAKQQKQIEALTAGLQKVSAQIEVSNSGPQTVLNNQ